MSSIGYCGIIGSVNMNSDIEAEFGAVWDSMKKISDNMTRVTELLEALMK